MSITLSDHAALVRARLVTAKDHAHHVLTLLTDDSLTTVMGSLGNTGFKKEHQRVNSANADVGINLALGELIDTTFPDDFAPAINAVAEHVKDRSAQRARLVHKACLYAIQEYMDQYIRPEIDNATQAIDTLCLELKSLVTAAVAQDDSMTSQRKQAHDDFDNSVKVISDAVTLISTIETNISSTQSEIDMRFDPNAILATAQDTDRANLALLRKDLESQKSYHERAMLEHCSRAARTRTSDTKQYSQELVVPDQLIEKGKGLELIDIAIGHMLSHIPQYFTLAPYLQRIGDDYNAADGTFWKPPDKSSDYSDVPIEFRKHFVTQNRAYALYLLSKTPPTASAAVLATYNYGLYKQYEGKASEDDGLAIYYGLVSISRPSAAAYREEIDHKLNNAADQFRSGNPAEKITTLRPFLTEAIRLKMRIKWTIGKKIITTLSLRHSTFAVDLAPLKETAPNSDDAAGHIDRLFSQITKTCTDIQAIQGDKWQSSFANVASISNRDTASTKECRYGDKCTRSDCHFYHKSGKSNQNSGKRTRSDTRGADCEAKNCRQKTDKKGLKLCTTCYKKGLQAGSLPLKDGTKMQLKKALSAKQQKTKEKKRQKDAPVFNPDQLAVLSQIHANSVTKMEIVDATSNLPPGPAAAKLSTVFDRLASGSQSDNVSSALLQITGKQ